LHSRNLYRCYFSILKIHNTHQISNSHRLKFPPALVRSRASAVGKCPQEASVTRMFQPYNGPPYTKWNVLNISMLVRPQMVAKCQQPGRSAEERSGGMACEMQKVMSLARSAQAGRAICLVSRSCTCPDFTARTGSPRGPIDYLLVYQIFTVLKMDCEYRPCGNTRKRAQGFPGSVLS
jgi:hypothetical protein